MPNIGFFKSLRPLDDARLGKQRQDALKVLKALMGEEEMRPHPVLNMWEGYEYTLGVYGMSACSIWKTERKKNENLAFEIHRILEDVPHELAMPPWMEDLDFHRSHRSYLIRRNPGVYEEMWPNTPVDMPLLWPQLVDSDPRGYRLRLSEAEKKLLASGERELPDWLEYNSKKREVINLEEE